MKEKLTVLIGEKEIQSRVEKLAAEISESYKGESLLVVGILRGAIMFMVDLLKKLEINDVQIDFMAVSSYGSSTVSSGKINIKKDLSESIEGRNVLIVEDIIDTGNTLYHLIEYLKKDNPRLRKKLFFISLPLIINFIYRKIANTHLPLSFYNTIFYKFIQGNFVEETAVISYYFSSSPS